MLGSKSYLQALTALFVLVAQPVSARSEALPDPLTADQVRSDIETWMGWTRTTHPDLSYSISLEELDAAITEILEKLPNTLTRAQAWRTMARLNPLFNDAHIGLLVPPMDNVPEEAIRLTISASPGRLLARSPDQHSAEPMEVYAVNGVDWRDLEQSAMARLRGENDALRRFIIERRLHGLLRLLLPEGELRTIGLRSQSGQSITLPLEASRLRFESSDASGYAISFEGNTATLFVPSFAREREQEFTVFLKEAFAAIAARGSENLVIDISQNGGGAHDLSDRLMAYLTDKPFAATSAITARIVPENQALVPGSKLGDVLTVPFADPVTPPSGLADRFHGNVTIKVGSKTYSQAIVFAATAQDIGVARLVGDTPEAPANQTGQVQTLTLPHTGFTARAPIYIIYRGSGDRSRAPLVIAATD